MLRLCTAGIGTTSTGTQYLGDVLLVSATSLALIGGGLCKCLACSAKPRGCQSCLVVRYLVFALLRVRIQWLTWLLLQVHDDQDLKQFWQELQSSPPKSIVGACHTREILEIQRGPWD